MLRISISVSRARSWLLRRGRISQKSSWIPETDILILQVVPLGHVVVERICEERIHIPCEMNARWARFYFYFYFIFLFFIPYFYYFFSPFVPFFLFFFPFVLSRNSKFRVGESQQDWQG